MDEIRLTECGLVGCAPATASEHEPIPARAAMVLTFDLPARVTVACGGPVRKRLVLQAVPMGANTCRVVWLATKRVSRGPQVAWSDAEPAVLAQDRRLLERAQPWYDRAGSPWEGGAEADAAPLLVRRLVALAASGPWEPQRGSWPPRRLVRVRASGLSLRPGADAPTAARRSGPAVDMTSGVKPCFRLGVPVVCRRPSAETEPVMTTVDLADLRG